MLQYLQQTLCVGSTCGWIVGAGVSIGVSVGSVVAVGTGTAVSVGNGVSIGGGVFVAVGRAVAVGSSVAVSVEVAVSVGIGVLVSVGADVAVGSSVLVAVRVAVIGTTFVLGALVGAESPPHPRSMEKTTRNRISLYLIVFPSPLFPCPHTGGFNTVASNLDERRAATTTGIRYLIAFAGDSVRLTVPLWAVIAARSEQQHGKNSKDDFQPFVFHDSPLHYSLRV